MKRLNFRKIKRGVKGITLIALVVTIIVLLILATVAINLTIGNNGIFKRAQMTTYKTEIGTIKEQLELKKMEGFIDGINITTSTIDDLDISDSLKERYGEKLIILDGVLYYNIDVVTDAEEQKWLEEMEVYPDNDIIVLRKYFLGEDGKSGKNITTLVDSNGNFINENNILEKECKSIYTLVANSENEANLYIKYNGALYKVITDYKIEFEDGKVNITMIAKGIERVFTSKVYEGEDLGKVTGEEKYNGWIILYDNTDEDGTVEAISPQILGSLTLGYGDESAQNVGDIDGNGVENENMDKAIYSYNNAVDRINQFCKEQIGEDIKNDQNLVSIRSVGSNPNDPNTDTNNYVEIEGIYNKKGREGDTNNEQDLLRILFYNANCTGGAYWLASRVSDSSIITGTEKVTFEINIGKDDQFGVTILWNTDGSCNNSTNGVRPIIKVKIN